MFNEAVDRHPRPVSRPRQPAEWARRSRSHREHALDPKVASCITAVIILGIVLRLARFLLNYPMWCDETMLAANLLDRGWSELAQPLWYRQVCPLGFLALQWLAVQALGFSEASLRLVPLCCALASMPLFHGLARRVLGPGTRGTLLAVAMFATAEPLIRYAGEAKPYEADLLVSLMLLNLAVKWVQSPGRLRFGWALTAAVPPAVALSLPSVFLIATIAVFAIIVAAKQRDRRLIAPLAAFVVVASTSCGVMAALGQYHTTPASRAYFLQFWASAFPPSWRDPLALARWLVATHTGPLFAIPHGAIPGSNWLTALVFGTFVLGACTVAKRRPELAALLVLPFLLTLAAAALRRYPYGMSIRVMLYLVPSIILLAAAGAAWLADRPRWRLFLGRRAMVALAAAAAILALARLGTDLGHPYRTPWDRTAREFARWFWEELAAESELVCVRTDLGIPFRPGDWAYDGSDQYVCFQRIYSERHRKQRPPRWDAISDARPLRCVLFNRMPEEVPAFAEWIKTHADRYTLRGVRTYRASRGSPREPVQIYVVCEFVPALRRTQQR